MEKDNLIKISREDTGFFTDIFLYDNKQKNIPSEDVLKIGETEQDDSIVCCNVVFFEDLETNELLKFSVDEDSELLSENIKSTNTYLINQMRDFVRINYDTISDYYCGLFDIESTKGALKIDLPPLPKSHSFLIDGYRFCLVKIFYSKYVRSSSIYH